MAGEKQKEKICIITASYPVIGGMGSVIRKLIDVLSSQYKVAVLSMKMMKNSNIAYHYELTPSSKLRVIFSPWNILTIMFYELNGLLWCLSLRKIGFKKFLIQDASFTGFFATVIGIITRAKVYIFDYGQIMVLNKPNYSESFVSKYHNKILMKVYIKILNVMVNFSLRYCYKFFACHPSMGKLACTLGLESKRLVLYNFPIDTSVFAPYEEKRKSMIRKELGINEKEILITYIGRLSPDKALPYLIKAARHLQAKYIGHIKFLIIGEGPLKKWVLNEIKKLPKDYAKYGGTLTKPEEISRILNASDIFIYPMTESGGYSVAFLEAMAVGVAGIITNVGPTKELLVNRETAIIIPPRDIKSLYNAIKLLIEDTWLREKIRNNAPKLIYEKFTIEHYQKTIINGLEK